MVVAVTLCGAVSVAGQSTSPVTQTVTPAAPEGGAVFEAASIRPAPPDAPRGIDYRFYEDRFVGTALMLSQLIELAYGIEARELTGGPDWIRGDRFDVLATAGSVVPRDRLQLMLQALLAERFQLEVARELREGSVYTLTAPNPRNLKAPADPNGRSLVSIIRDDSNGYLKYRYEGRNAPMSALVRQLAGQLRAPVNDATGLAGTHDFIVTFAYDMPFGGLDPDPNVPTIFTALETDLGLKLVAGRGAITMYVVRRAAKPSGN